MSDTFYIKQGSTSPAITGTLLDGNNDPVNLTGATVEFHMVGPADVSGAANILVAADGTVAYDWEPTDLDEWGGYAVEWVVTDGGNTDVHPGPGYNWVEVLPRVDTLIAGVTDLLHVRRELGRAMADSEAARALGMIGELSALLERKLNRKFATVEIIETHHHFGPQGELQLLYGPVTEVSEISLNGSPYTSSIEHWQQIYWPRGSRVEVTYTAGSVADEGVKAGVARVIARSLIVAPNISVGAVGGYSVEGTSITFTGVDAAGQVGKFTVGDLSSFSRLRIPVFFT